jgi:hypothetical protein
VLGRRAGLVQQRIPVSGGDMPGDQLLDLLLATFCRSMSRRVL